MKLSLFEFSIFPFIKIVIMFLMIMVVFPMIFSFDKRKLSLSKSFFRYLMQGIFFVSLSAYVLTTFKLFEFFTLIGIYLIVCYVMMRKNRRLKDVNIMSDAMLPFYVKLFDVIDNEKSFKAVFIHFWTRFKNGIITLVSKITAEKISVFLVFVLMITIRFSTRILNPMAMASMADPYVHLTWAKMMRFNRLFTDGVYPMGYQAIIASLGTVANVDIYHVVRFMGAIGSSLLVLGLYWFLKLVTKNRMLAIIGTIAFGLSTFNGLPVEFFRQTLSLSMEFSMAFILPGLIFLHDYIKEDSRNDLILYGFSVVSVVMVHSYGALFLAIGTTALLASALINRCLNLKNVFRIFLTGLLGGFLGMLPIIIGRLQGIEWHIMSTSWIESNVRIGSWDEIVTGFSKLLADTPVRVVYLAVFVTSVLLIVSLKNLIYAKKKKRLWEATILILMFMVTILYYGPENGFSLLDYTRVTMFLTITILIGVVLCLNHIVELFNIVPRALNKKTPDRILVRRVNKIANALFIAVFAMAWMIAFPIQLTSDDEMAMRPIEYNSAVGVYFQVKRDYPLFNWTLVAPVEQYQEALGYGYHYELWEFVRDFTIEDAKNPNFGLPIPTSYIFIYVEKVPLRIWTNNELETTQERFRGPTEIYYRDADGRAKLQENIWAWCEAYRETHDNMTVYFEDDVLKVYKVVHDPTPYIDHINLALQLQNP